MKNIEEIVKRAIALTVLVSLVGLERGAYVDVTSEEDKVLFKQGTRQWLKRHDLIQNMTEEEQFFLNSECGKTPFQIFRDISWSYECIRPLLWGAGLDDLVPYDGCDCNANGIPAEKLQIDTGDKTENFQLKNVLSKCRMRSYKEIEIQEMVAMLWHWRAIELDTELPKGETWIGVIRRIFGEEAEEALKYIPHQQRGKQDFLVGKTPAGKLSPKKKYMLQEISALRHRAFEWMLSDDDWDEVTTDT